MDDKTIAILSLVVGSIISLASLAIGAAGFIFGVYKHFSTLRRAKLSYTMTQLSDYDLPPTILGSLNGIPFVIEVQSTGNKQAESVNIEIVTASDIQDIKVEMNGDFNETRDIRKVCLHIPFINPGETIKISGKCVPSDRLKKYVEEVKITHSEGIGEKAA